MHAMVLSRIGEWLTFTEMPDQVLARLAFRPLKGAFRKTYARREPFSG
jgi:hypothetical protein